MPTISRRQFTAAFGGISVAALAASATTLPAAAEPGGGELDPLRSMRVPRGLRTADGPIWSATATGFAGLPTPELPHGTVGGYGGSLHVVRDSEQLARAIQIEGPATVLVEGTLVVEPFGANLAASSHTSILGAGRGAEIVGGASHLDKAAGASVVSAPRRGRAPSRHARVRGGGRRAAPVPGRPRRDPGPRGGIRILARRGSSEPRGWQGKGAADDNGGARLDSSARARSAD